MGEVRALIGPGPISSLFPSKENMQVKMISDSLLETLFNLLYKLETLRLLAGCSVGLDFCCKTEVVISVLAALIIASQPPPLPPLH